MQTANFTASRRALLRQAACGFGALAAAELLSRPVDAMQTGLLHHVARARRVIFLFMHGGPSQVDTFDPKPALARYDGKTIPIDLPSQVDAKPIALKSPWKFRQHGQSGLWVSELFPELAKVADELCVIRSMHTRGQSHGQAVSMLNTGSDNLVRPSLGSWVSYGLGNENENLPSFVALSPASSHGGPRNHGSAFLPTTHQATTIGVNGKFRDGKIPNLESNHPNRHHQIQQLALLQQYNRRHLASSGPDAAIEGAIASYEMAFRMQTAAPDVLRIEDEPGSIRRLYGIDQAATASFGKNCLLARRLAEAGVRFIQISTGNVWDQHGNLYAGHQKNAAATDLPLAGLIHDLKQRGMLDETLIVWSGEFGRTPVVQGRDGRDHNPQGFTAFLAGGGVKSGLAFGETDELGFRAVRDRVHMHDLHATILHLLGIDHQRLTYRYAGRDFRLTDVYGRVVDRILA